MGGGQVNAVVDLQPLEERVAKLVKDVGLVRTVWWGVGRRRNGAVELVEVGGLLERKAEAWREVVVLGLA